MLSPVVIRSYPEGPRVWIAGQRVHHGAVGALLCAATLATHRRYAALAAAVLVAHDAHDWRVWFAREGLPPASTLDPAGPLL